MKARFHFVDSVEHQEFFNQERQGRLNRLQLNSKDFIKISTDMRRGLKSIEHPESLNTMQLFPTKAKSDNKRLRNS